MSDNHNEEFAEKRLTEAEKHEEFYLSTIQMLQTEERFVNYFQQYQKKSVDGFIKFYAQQKVKWYEIAESLHEHRINNAKKWRHEAVRMLREIFYKKLFNLKCRWVAGEMDIEGVETSHDFMLWKTNEALHRMVEPITQHEVECYIGYLLQSERLIEEYKAENPDDTSREPPRAHIAFEFYHKHRAWGEDRADKDLPLWFLWYDKEMGTEYLSLLPVTRMEIEAYYHDDWCSLVYFKTLTDEQKEILKYSLSRKQRRELNADKTKKKEWEAEQSKFYAERDAKEPKYRHLWLWEPDVAKELLDHLETPAVRELYRANREWRDRSNNENNMLSVYFQLMDVKENVPVSSSNDWRNSMKQALEDYKQKMKLEMIQPVFEEYLEAIKQNKLFDWNAGIYDNDGMNNQAASVNEMKNRLLDARKAKGESANFDFLKKENLKNHPL